jgi:hypothetical protein
MPVLTLRTKAQLLHEQSQRKEWHMQSTNIRQIKAALWQQAFLGGTQVSCPIGRIMAIKKRKGQLLALIRGWGQWYTVESVRIE